MSSLPSGLTNSICLTSEIDGFLLHSSASAIWSRSMEMSEECLASRDAASFARQFVRHAFLLRNYAFCLEQSRRDHKDLWISRVFDTSKETTSKILVVGSWRSPDRENFQFCIDCLVQDVKPPSFDFNRAPSQSLSSFHNFNNC